MVPRKSMVALRTEIKKEIKPLSKLVSFREKSCVCGGKELIHLKKSYLSSGILIFFKPNVPEYSRSFGCRHCRPKPFYPTA